MKILFLILTHHTTQDKLHACLRTWVPKIESKHDLIVLGDCTMEDNIQGHSVYKPLNNETYYDLPEKMYRSYRHVLDMEWDYLVKTDDDCYLNIDNLHSSLAEMSSIDKLYTGQGIHFKTKTKPNYLSNCDDKLPPEQYTMYYAQGGCYIMSKSALNHSIDKMQYKKPPFSAEDVMVGMAMTDSDIVLHDRPDLFDCGWVGRGWGPGTGGCRSRTPQECIDIISNKHISVHRTNAFFIQKIHNNLRKITNKR